jgi:tetratricopeptide (TPR) repeat protein
MPTAISLLVWSALLISLFAPGALDAQVGVVGKIIGNVRVSRSDFPDHPVLVSVETHGAIISSAYTDGQGRFGFYNLIANPYKITINDDAFEPFSVSVDLNPDTAPMAFVQVTLIPRANAKKDPLPGRVTGGNPALVAPAEYNQQFPKKTVKEFEKGVQADHKGNPEQAIQHYLKALTSSPDFYPAHNNLGTVYLSRKDFEAAQSQFEAALRTNQNDGQAYFNLANVSILMNRFLDAQRYLDDGFRRQPESALGRFLLGTLNLRTGKLPEAEAALTKAIELDPSMAQPRLQLINLFLKQGRKPDAVAQLHVFLTANPLSPFSPQAKQMLERLEASPAQAGAVPQSNPQH